MTTHVRYKRTRHMHYQKTIQPRHKRTSHKRYIKKSIKIYLGIHLLKMTSLYRLFSGLLQHHYGVAWNFKK